jgi:hypothetical protein
LNIVAPTPETSAALEAAVVFKSDLRVKRPDFFVVISYFLQLIGPLLLCFCRRSGQTACKFLNGKTPRICTVVAGNLWFVRATPASPLSGIDWSLPTGLNCRVELQYLNHFKMQMFRFKTQNMRF